MNTGEEISPVIEKIAEEILIEEESLIDSPTEDIVAQTPVAEESIIEVAEELVITQ